MNPRGDKVLAEKGSKSVYLTVLFTGNSMGQMPPPMIVYRYKRVPLRIAQAIPPEWAIERSENGWMTQELFYEYVANIFQPWLKEKKIDLPIIFFLDGDSSHISLHLSKFCIKNGIELIALYPNATHLIQPMDVAVFHSLKTDWRKLVQEWRMSHTGEELKKKDFPSLLQTAINKIEPSILKNGFKKCGLVPWNPKAINLPISLPSPPTQADRNKVRAFITYLETEIGPEKLSQFRSNEGDWKGSKEDLSQSGHSVPI